MNANHRNGALGYPPWVSPVRRSDGYSRDPILVHTLVCKGVMRP